MKDGGGGHLVGAGGIERAKIARVDVEVGLRQVVVHGPDVLHHLVAQHVQAGAHELRVQVLRKRMREWGRGRERWGGLPATGA